MNTITCRLILMFSAVFFAMPVLADQSQGYTLGVFPHLPPRQLEKVYAPIAKEFSEVLGKQVQLRSSSSYEKFMENLDNEKFDIVFVQPFDYVRAADKLGYKPLAVREEPLATIYVVKQGSTLKSAKDLKGKRIALPPKVAAVSLLTMGFLKEQKLQPGKDVTISHHKSHASCLQQVLIGEADVCGTALPALRFFQHKMKVKMEIVAKTSEIPHALFAAHPRLSEKEFQEVQENILSWSKTKKGQEILKRGKLSNYKRINDSDYNIVRKMGSNKQ